MSTEFGKALRIVSDELKKDGEMRMAFKANIAMAFKDEYARRRRQKNNISYEDIHHIANDGAEYFLNLLCEDSAKF